MRTLATTVVENQTHFLGAALGKRVYGYAGVFVVAYPRCRLISNYLFWEIFLATRDYISFHKMWISRVARVPLDRGEVAVILANARTWSTLVAQLAGYPIFNRPFAWIRVAIPGSDEAPLQPTLFISYVPMYGVTLQISVPLNTKYGRNKRPLFPHPM